MYHCKICNEPKTQLEMYQKSKCICLICGREKARVYAQNPRLIAKAKLRSSRPEVLEKNRLAEQKRKEDVEYDLAKKEYMRQYREDNKEKLALDRQTPENRARNAAQGRKHRAKAKIEDTEEEKQAKRDYHNDYTKAKLENNPACKIASSVSRLIRYALKKQGKTKERASSWKYLPYSSEELKSHLESLFSHPDNLVDGKVWMTWKNHGVYLSSEWNDEDQTTWRWQMDHIVQQNRFPYTSMEDDNFQKCWSLSNLRPYSAKKNVIEGDRVDRIADIINSEINKEDNNGKR